MREYISFRDMVLVWACVMLFLLAFAAAEWVMPERATDGRPYEEVTIQRINEAGGTAAVVSFPEDARKIIDQALGG